MFFDNLNFFNRILLKSLAHLKKKSITFFIFKYLNERERYFDKKNEK